MNTADYVIVTLTPDGFFVAVQEDDGFLRLEDVLVYVGSLLVPGANRGEVERAFLEARGMPVRFAPPLGGVSRQATPPPQAATVSPAAVQGQNQRRAVRWLRPLFKKSAMVREAKAVLVIDAGTTISSIFTAAFPDASSILRQARSPQDFFSFCATGSPDLIMLPASLGKADGGLLAYRIRTDPKTASVPVIMYSGLRPRNEIVRQFECGITDYVVLPIAPDAFRDRVQNTLAQVKKTIPIKEEPLPQETANAETTPQQAKPVVSLRVLVAKVEELMAVPYILERVMTITGDSSAGVKDLALAIESDTATVTAVLKKANTVFYAKNEPVRDVKEAIVRVGFDEVRALVLGLSVVQQFSKEQKSNGFNRMDFWRHSLGTAILAKSFAEQIKFSSPEQAFLAGLLHDVGKLILDEHANPPFDDILMQAISSQKPLIEKEGATLGFTHVDVGSAILRQWKFPESLISAVSRHHSPESREREKSKPQELVLVRLVYLANLMVKALRVGSGGDLSIKELSLETWTKSFGKLKIDDETRSNFQKQFEGLGEFLGVTQDFGGPSVREGDLPDIVVYDPLREARLLCVLETHLMAAGHKVLAVSREADIVPPSEVRHWVLCIMIDKFSRVKKQLDDLQLAVPSGIPQTIVILPEDEADDLARSGRAERPAFLNASQTIIYEPYAVEELKNALEPPALE